MPRILLLVLVMIAVLYAVRQFNKLRQEMPRREVPRARPTRPRPVGPAAIEAEDLVVCRACGTYLPAAARHCGKPACPQPR